VRAHDDQANLHLAGGVEDRCGGLADPGVDGRAVDLRGLKPEPLKQFQRRRLALGHMENVQSRAANFRKGLRHRKRHKRVLRPIKRDEDDWLGHWFDALVRGFARRASAGMLDLCRSPRH
jgi:hypothetical protein